MAYGDNITEAIPTPIGNPVNNQTYQQTGVAYDIAIGGQPFFMDTADGFGYWWDEPSQSWKEITA